jgi:lipid-A-disaccharide synthase
MVKGFSRRGVAVEACTGEDVFARADAAVIKSGTMTLEAALALCPYTVFYRVSRVSFFIMARLWGAAKEIRFVSLPNILSGKELAREFIQREAKAEALAEEALRLIEDEAEAARQRAALSAFRQTMGAGNASARASEALCEFAANIQNRKENI